MEILTLYVLTILNSLHQLLVVMTVTGVIALVVGGMMFWCNSFDERNYSGNERFAKEHTNAVYWKGCGRSLIRLWPAVLAVWLLAVLVPDRKDAMFILAGTAVLEAAHSETAQRLAGKSVELVEQYLDSLIEKKKK